MLGVRDGKPALKNQGKQQLSIWQRGNNRCVRHTGMAGNATDNMDGEKVAFNLVSQTFTKFLFVNQALGIKPKQTNKQTNHTSMIQESR